ncbi:MAG: hypothetical protein ACE5JB_00590 [bacterium]
MDTKYKTINCFICLLMMLFFATTTAKAQEEYEKWLKKQQQAFQEFKDKRDKEFTEFLKKEWRKMQLFEGIKRDEKPKPKKMPVAEKLPPRDIKPQKIRIIKDIPLPKYVPPVEPDLEEKPEPMDIDKSESMQLNFLDTPLKMHYDRVLKVPTSNAITKETISAYWSAMSRADYESILNRAQYFRKKLRLNDWGYAYLLYKIGEDMYPDSLNQRKLFVWFMLSKSGYEAKIGHTSDSIYLLLPSVNFMYSVPYLTIDNKKYFVVSFEGKPELVKTLYTYEGRYPNADKEINLKIEALPNIKTNVASKKLKFSYRGKEYTLTVKYNKNVVNFFQNYPQTNLEVYFDAPVSPDANYSLLSALRPIVNGKSETEAVNVLLRFVQTAFDYQTDRDQFGKEKYFFSEETLFYPYSDCEDRAILFAYLVSNLLRLEVIGLDYPGHIATAVHFTDDIKGDYVMYRHKKFIICDPTYINADLGMSIPEVKNATPEVLEISFSMR